MKVPVSNCTACGHELDGATAIDDNILAPKSGDVAICIHCGHLMAMDDQLNLRNLTDEEMKEVAGDPRIITLQKARKALKALN